MTIKGSAILIVLVVSLASCSNRQTGEVSVKEDLIAKQLLQGIWVNDETEMPLMRIEGDTVYYANPQSAPVPFKVVHDTIYIYSNEPVAYKIDRQTEYSFWFHSLADEVIKLHKSENAEDSLVFTSREVEVISTTPEVFQAFLPRFLCILLNRFQSVSQLSPDRDCTSTDCSSHCTHASYPATAS